MPVCEGLSEQLAECGLCSPAEVQRARLTVAAAVAAEPPSAEQMTEGSRAMLTFDHMPFFSGFSLR